MDCRNRKRTESGELLPVDKRACSSTASPSSPPPPSPSSSVRSADVGEAPSTHAYRNDERTSSSDEDYVESTSSSDEDDAEADEEEEGDDDISYGDEEYEAEQGVIDGLLAGLRSPEEGPRAAALAALTEMLLYTTVKTIDMLLPSLYHVAQALVAVLNSDAGAETLLAAVQAIFYLCDMIPGSVRAMVHQGAAPVLCRRLLELEYMDVGEQCIKVLEKLSQTEPMQCLEAGAVMACLSLFDFFPVDVQIKLLSAVVNMCKNIPPSHSQFVVDAVPILTCSLPSDNFVVAEKSAAGLRMIVESFIGFNEKLDLICEDELISLCVMLIGSNNWKTSGEVFINDLMRILSVSASCSPKVIKTLLSTDIGTALRGSLLMCCNSTTNVSDSMSARSHLDEVPEVLKLLNQLLAPVRDPAENNQESLAKEHIFVDEPHLLHQFAFKIFHLLIEVIESETTLCKRYGCLSTIKSIVFFSTPETLLDLLKDTNISRLLAKLLSDENDHMVVSTLHIAEILLKKHPEQFLRLFIKEGVLYAIGMLSKLDDGNSAVHQVSSSDFKYNNSPGCLCFAFDLTQSRMPQSRSCKYGKAICCELAKNIKFSYFASFNDGDSSTNQMLSKLKTYCSVFDDNVQKFSLEDYNLYNEEYLTLVLGKIIALIKMDDMSAFEFVGSGIVKSFMNYLCDGHYFERETCSSDRQCRPHVVLKRCQHFITIMSSKYIAENDNLLLTVLVRKLLDSLHSHVRFPVISNQPFDSRHSVHADISDGGHTAVSPCFKVIFVRDDTDFGLHDFSANALMVEPSSSFSAIEKYLWPNVSMNKSGSNLTGRLPQYVPVGYLNATQLKDIVSGELPYHIGAYDHACIRSDFWDMKAPTSRKMIFYLAGKEIDHSFTLYQAIMEHKVSKGLPTVPNTAFWNKIYKITYKKAEERNYDFLPPSGCNQRNSFWEELPFFSSLLTAKIPCILENGDPCYDILFLLSTLEGMNKYASILSLNRESNTFCKERLIDSWDPTLVKSLISPLEFQSNILSKKLLQQIPYGFSSHIGNTPTWFSQLVILCPFLFSFDARHRFFRVACLASYRANGSRVPFPDNPNSSSIPRSGPRNRKYKVNRSYILESAKKIMESSAHNENFEVEYKNEIGSGLGLQLEFYTLVSQALQKSDLGLWRDGHCLSSHLCPVTGELKSTSYVAAPFGLFPRPWSAINSSLNMTEETTRLSKFKLLGWLVARALSDERFLDIPLSRAFYKLMFEQELNIYDISTFDPELGRTLLEFQTLVSEKGFMEKKIAGNFEIQYRGTEIEDLCISFTLPGYPDYPLTTERDSKMVNSSNLEEFICLVVDATVKSGISKQMKAFKSGFSKVFPLSFLRIFTKEEVELLLCGERDTWTFEELRHNISFEHGYTVSSPQAIHLLEVIHEFKCEQRRAFLQFVSATPRLPPGGLAALKPKLTVVRKDVPDCTDVHLPSVMTCANYLKLPPYSSKEKLREKLLYAITEGQGSFQLS